jgi:hypothetical protein
MTLSQALKHLAAGSAFVLGMECIAWWVFGAFVLWIPLSLIGLLMAPVLVELACEIWYAMRRSIWRPVEGRYFAFHGRPVHVLEDADHRRWIRLSDVRAIAGFTASDGALRLTYPNGWRLCGRPAVPHLSDEALLAHLAKERAPTAAKLRHWVEREIGFSARRKREHRDIKAEALNLRQRPETASQQRIRATSEVVE